MAWLPVRFLVKGSLISTVVQFYLLENRKILQIIWVIVETKPAVELLA